ncbi:MAG TPA: protein kinase [Thermoanaerobaculia bacterium]|nr:protein kinase [Thermoanaerobaculia bacterium]
MNAERWSEVCRLFDAARELAAQERAALLDRECAGDSDLRAEVDSLLAKDEGDSFLDEPGPAAMPVRLSVGPYEIVAEIGRGGMGVVYEAVRRDQGFERSVAVKLVKRGMDTDFVLRRFESERRILAELDHPNIARVLDGGSTEDGLPYFVMELIRGENLLGYCEGRKLDVPGKLALFRQVCSAVTYAHQRLVIHRDIKPANVLVTDEGIPKLLDFGIAKVLAADRDAADRTETALRILTPEYASPEQILGKDITTSSDVYSLGVVLYGLLTGRRPYRVETHRPEEISAAVLSQQPERPSTRARIPADLDSIVLMALRKEPDRRYASAEQLSEDIRRHLEGLPVIARKDTIGYRARKFLARHRTGAAAAAVLLVSLIGGIAATTREARIAERERQRAERRLNGVRKLTNTFLFEFHDAIKNLAGSTPARELVVRRALEYLGMLAAEGQNDLSLQRELAAAYQKVGDVQGLGGGPNLGDSAGALKSYRAAQGILERLAASGAAPLDLEELAGCHLRLSKLFILRKELAQALQEGRRSVAIREELLQSGAAVPRLAIRIAEVRRHIGLILHMTGDKDGAVAELDRAREGFEAALRTDPSDLEAGKGKAGTLFEMASVQQDKGDSLAARGRAEEALAIDQALLAVHPEDARLKLDVAMTLHDIGEYDGDLGERKAALARMREAHAITEELAAADPRNAQARLSRGYCMRDLAKLLAAEGELAEALRLDRTVVQIMEALLQEDPANGYARALLARACAGAGNTLSPAVSPAPMPGLTEAERWRQSRAWYRRSLELWDAIRAAGKLGTDAREAETVSASLARCEKALKETPGVVEE